jgi:hypothetical protein
VNTLTTLLSFTQGKKILANPWPASAPPSCKHCQDLNFRREMPPNAEVVHWVKWTAVTYAAMSGCRGCNLLRRCLQRIFSVYGDTNNSPVLLMLQSIIDGGPLFVCWDQSCYNGSGKVMTSISMRAEIYIHLGIFHNYGLDESSS